MAQYYHIIEWEKLPLEKRAALVYGLPPQSRTKERIKGEEQRSLTEVLLAIIADKLALLTWMQTEDAKTGQNRPESILDALLGLAPDNDFESFDTPEDFERERRRLLQGEETTV